MVRLTSPAVRSSVSPFSSRTVCVGFTDGTVAGSTPAPGRNELTGGVKPMRPGIIGIPFGMGIGIPAAMLSPLMPGMFMCAGFAPGFFDDGALAESCVMPGIPAIGSGFFGGGFVCPSVTLGVTAMSAVKAAARRQWITERPRGTAGATGTSAASRSAMCR